MIEVVAKMSSIMNNKPSEELFYILRTLKRAIANTLKIFDEEKGGSCTYIDNVEIRGLASTQFSNKNIKSFALQYNTTTLGNCEIFVEGMFIIDFNILFTF